MIQSSVSDVVRDHARQRPDADAFTFVDYEVDPDGYSETLSWSQLYQRVRVVAAALSTVGSVGDRVAIMAPQGLEYIVGLLGAFEAGRIAVPLPVPEFGAHDERASSALRDSAPVALLTTSTVADHVVSCAGAVPGFVPAVIEVDALDLDSPDRQPDVVYGRCETAVLQYTSGSTRDPAAVEVTHKNIFANIEQVAEDYFELEGNLVPPGLTLVSWLPFYHDMGLLLGINGAIMFGVHAVVMSPMAFLQKPARYLQLLASHSKAFSAVPNFAFELTARRTKAADMEGYDLSDVHTVLSGSERVHAATIRRFTEHFAPYNFPPSALKPSYGLAEAMVYAGSSKPGRPPFAVWFDYEKLSDGVAVPPREGQVGCELVSVGPPRACTVRIVDPETRTENEPGRVGEIWLHGDNVAKGYWQKPALTQRTFGGQLADPSPGTPSGPWLRTGDLGVLYEGELFIVGRIKDLLIVDGRNHYPDDIEATTQEITGGRVAAISVANDRSEQLVVIAEMKKKGSDEEALHRLRDVRKVVSSEISKLHGVRVADLVLVPAGSIPITTSGKIRRSSCIEVYQQDEFTRLDSLA